MPSSRENHNRYVIPALAVALGIGAVACIVVAYDKRHPDPRTETATTEQFNEHLDRFTFETLGEVQRFYKAESDGASTLPVYVAGELQITYSSLDAGQSNTVRFICVEGNDRLYTEMDLDPKTLTATTNTTVCEDGVVRESDNRQESVPILDQTQLRVTSPENATF